MAALSLAEDIQIRNVRKVKVNAQVAFAIYVVELFGVIIGILWLFFDQIVIDLINKQAGVFARIFTQQTFNLN